MTQAEIAKLPLWITRSLRKHFKAFKGDWEMFFEGSDKVSETGKSYTDLPAYFEYRCSGPSTRFGCKGYTTHHTYVNILITANNPKDIDLIHKMLVQMKQAFQLTIDIFKIGAEQDDNNDTKIGCAALVANDHQHILVTDFGQLREDSTIRQLTVEAEYRMEIFNGSN